MSARNAAKKNREKGRNARKKSNQGAPNDARLEGRQQQPIISFHLVRLTNEIREREFCSMFDVRSTRKKYTALSRLRYRSEHGVLDSFPRYASFADSSWRTIVGLYLQSSPSYLPSYCLLEICPSFSDLSSSHPFALPSFRPLP